MRNGVGDVGEEGSKKKRHLTIIIVPSSQTCCCRLPWATPRPRPLLACIRRCIHCRHACWCYGASRRKTRARDEDEERCGGGERGRGRLERVRDVPPLRDTAPLLCSLTCCLLLIIILFLYLSLQKHALLAPAAWQPLVSLTQLLCRLSHSQHSPTTPPPHTTALSPQQHRTDAAALESDPTSLFLPRLFGFSEKNASTKM